MDKILAQRYAFYDFSKIVSFPNPMPSRDEWEGCLPRFRGENWEVPAEFLLYFHEYLLKLKFLHEDVLIKLFRYSLDGAAHDWCRSLSIANVSSLKSFHISFHSFYEDKFSVDFLYQECCHEFDLLYKGSYNHERSSYVEENVTVEEDNLVKEISEGSMLFSSCSSVLDANSNDSFDHKNTIEISPNYEAEINDKLVKKN
jgi:hypothetical protein